MAPLLVMPAVIGIVILAAYGRDPLSRMAAFFTLKPVVAAPLWGAILIWTRSYNLNETGPAFLLSMLPGAILTLLIVWKFRSLFRGAQSRWAWILLGLDGVRWSNSLFLSWSPHPVLGMVSVSVATVMPTLCALVALGVATRRRA
jgi:hypothetical protein